MDAADFPAFGGPNGIDLDAEDARQARELARRHDPGAHKPFGFLLALLWLIAVGAIAVGAVGLEQLFALDRALLAGLGVMGVLPAFFLVFAGSAAAEGARARQQAERLADAADRLLSPGPAAETAARRVGVSVRGEIVALERALDQVTAKLTHLHSMLSQNMFSLEGAADGAEEQAQKIVSGLERERQALAELARGFQAQSEHIRDSVSRHARMIADAARVAEAEVRAADDALDSRLSSFGAAAALLHERTAALAAAAAASADSSLSLDESLSRALDTLAKATSLTDAARLSATNASQAAGEVSGAMRDIVFKGIEEARRAAEAIRMEASGADQFAATAFSRLQDAAESVGRAADAARAQVASAAAEAERRIHDMSDEMFRATADAERLAGARIAEVREQLEAASRPIDQSAAFGGYAPMRPAFPQSFPQSFPQASPEPAPAREAAPRVGFRLSETRHLENRPLPIHDPQSFGQIPPAKPAAGRAAQPAPQPAPKPQAPAPLGFSSQGTGSSAPPNAASPNPQFPGAPQGGGREGGWTWKDFLASIEEPRADAPRKPAAVQGFASSNNGAFGAAPSFPAPPEPAKHRPENRDDAPLPGRFGPTGGSGDPGAMAPMAGEPAGTSRNVGFNFGLSAHAPAAPNRSDAREPSPEFAPDPAPGRPGPHDAWSPIDLVTIGGVRLREVFSVLALERIAHRARSGSDARRRAVMDAAPDAVRRLATFFSQQPNARKDAESFLQGEGARIGEALGRGRAAIGGDLVRAYLLIDSALN